MPHRLEMCLLVLYAPILLRKHYRHCIGILLHRFCSLLLPKNDGSKPNFSLLTRSFCLSLCLSLSSPPLPCLDVMMGPMEAFALLILFCNLARYRLALSLPLRYNTAASLNAHFKCALPILLPCVPCVLPADSALHLTNREYEANF